MDQILIQQISSSAFFPQRFFTTTITSTTTTQDVSHNGLPFTCVSQDSQGEQTYQSYEKNVQWISSTH